MNNQTGIKFPTTGTPILYVLEDGPHAGEVRPGVIIKANGTGGLATENSPPQLPTCNLAVFMDGDNDGPQYRNLLAWKTSVPFSEIMEPRTFHYLDTPIQQATGSKAQELSLGGRSGGVF